ncbi:H-2 class II histocompatibility antigen, A-U alpha chain-like [Thalassophryne amazonica]|uniref:H-2 class II histocompatibility antigen, A-U alpha chain-like n=1 Tax=Thalassophryne amazonica TaxID=390379 RepID=UPI0014713BC1|nr:H-2 class II histocompatibility antigen, A-U alpha chain-like [Thalassophryne amazonica]
MMICSGFKNFAFTVLLLKTCYAFSKFRHEASYTLSCFFNETAQVQFSLDGDEYFYIDSQKEEIVFIVPDFITHDPTLLLTGHRILRTAKYQSKYCKAVMELIAKEEEHPLPEKDPPETIVYPEEEVELGVENRLICFVNHFYPPSIKVSWTKNGHLVSDGVSIGQYHPNNDQTFHQTSTLTFTPRDGDVYGCKVEHTALDSPKTKIWECNLSRASPEVGPDVFCGVGLLLGLLGISAGTFLFVKAQHQQK